MADSIAVDVWVDQVTVFSAASMNVPVVQVKEAITLLSVGIYDIGGTFENTPVGGEIILRFPVTRTIMFPADMDGSRMEAAVAATDTAVISIRKNNAEFATITFVAGTSTGIFSGTQTEFTSDDTLTLVCPSTPDATLAELGWCLSAERTILVLS